MRWIHWNQWTNTGSVICGRIRVKDVDRQIRRFEQRASKILKSTNADHVLYAIKEYDNDDELVSVSFYTKPMTDKQYEDNVACLTGVLVYALHARR